MIAGESYFANIYRPGIGGVLGSLYASRESADAAASGHRIDCIQVVPAARVAAILTPNVRALCERHSASEQVSFENIVAEAVSCFVAIHPEVLAAARRYAGKTHAPLSAVIAQAARDYFVGAAP